MPYLPRGQSSQFYLMLESCFSDLGTDLMTIELTVEELAKLAVCSSRVGQRFLFGEIICRGHEGLCSYCKDAGPSSVGYDKPFDSEAYYDERDIDDEESQSGWLHFEESLTTEARYFNPAAEAVLTSTFEGIAKHKTHEGRPIIVDAGPGTGLTSLYRARVFQSVVELEEALKRPDLEVGPPPSTSASHGRMNAHGVSVFYAA